MIDAESAGALRAEIRNARGSPVAEVTDLLPGDEDRVEFLIPRRALVEFLDERLAAASRNEPESAHSRDLGGAR